MWYEDMDDTMKKNMQEKEKRQKRWKDMCENPPSRAEVLNIDPATYIKKVFDPHNYYAVPSKVFAVDEVVGLAKQLGVLLDMDVQVELHNTHVYIEMNFDEMPIMGDLKLQFLTLLGLVDEVSFFRPENSEHDFRITLLYKTHLYIQSGNTGGRF